jgi:hypothetical protein
MSWLLGLFGGKVQLYAVAFLLIAVATLGFTTYKMIQKNGALEYEVADTKEQLVTYKKTMDLKDAAATQSKDSETKALRELSAINQKHALEKKNLYDIIELLKKEGAQNGQDQGAVDCLNKLVPKPIINDLFGLQPN